MAALHLGTERESFILLGRRHILLRRHQELPRALRATVPRLGGQIHGPSRRAITRLEIVEGHLDLLAVQTRLGFALLNPSSGAIRRISVIRHEEDASLKDKVRMNDGGIDARGRWWAGSMALDEESIIGRLWRLDGGEVKDMSEGNEDERLPSLMGLSGLLMVKLCIRVIHRKGRFISTYFQAPFYNKATTANSPGIRLISQSAVMSNDSYITGLTTTSRMARRATSDCSNTLRTAECRIV
ncbi:hypothetical protein RRF57_007138 [Xylaria bambusicola]|uniref:SMP-30/Gluconolactonase/LRE-like region domain-containing protein n=1 Tax=Xylaria bambusicola TaxID=326684 RepID=A0AAN7UUN5_9PEZI